MGDLEIDDERLRLHVSRTERVVGLLRDLDLRLTGVGASAPVARGGERP